MKKIHQFFSLLAICLLFVSCNYLQPNKEENLSLEKDFKTVKISGKYQMAIPSYMKKTNELNDEASLQYNNLFKETYVIVIDESKEQFVSAMQEAEMTDTLQSTIENYKNIQMQLLKGNINISSEKNTEKKTINGLDIEQVEFVGKIPGVDDEIVYILTFIEGKNDLYMIMSWTLNKYSKKYSNTFHKMADSFKEL